MDTVARRQLDLDEMRAESRRLGTPGGRDSPSQPRQVTFTSTKVPKCVGVTSWEQYRQVFDANVNQMDRTTPPLPYSCSLIWRGDPLNVALLVPESRRESRVGLVGALTAHYGSPGRLADYRRQFENNPDGRGRPYIIATSLEALVIKAFGDMGQTARLRIIKDRFVAGHDSCQLRQHFSPVHIQNDPPQIATEFIPPPQVSYITPK